MTEETTSLGASLVAGEFETPPLRLPIPGKPGEYFKTELVVTRSLERTVKLLWWHADDYREDPHNHPWDFTSEILAGGYIDDRYWFDSTGELQHEQHELRAGDINGVLHDEYHNVIDVLPGTRTRMTCGPLIDNDWHYINAKTGDRIDIDPDYGKLVFSMNTHLGTWPK